ncbi:hypothetical protein SAMD00019534_072030, partial [Acytostelium subglobosum LB1]|uniref:hypothetical protein n=1 Tax=Acytostelium subglobosum LB1 TaxID=1410327 RepID=UPI000644ED75
SIVNYLIPTGFIARLQQQSNESNNINNNRLYCNSITLDSSVFIIRSITSTSKLVSLMHIDLYSGSISSYQSLLTSELDHHLSIATSTATDAATPTATVTVWRCHNIPISKEPKAKQQQTNREIDDLWIKVVEKHSAASSHGIKFMEINVVETASISLNDEAPLLHRIPEQSLQQCPIDETLIKSVVLLNDIMSFPVMSWLTNNDNTHPSIQPSLVAIAKYREFLRIPAMKQQKVGVNDVCPCKSGQKFKKCHGATGNSKQYYSYPTSDTSSATTSTTKSTTTSKSTR